MNEATMKIALQIINPPYNEMLDQAVYELQKCKCGSVFAKPLDIVAQNLPQYLDIIEDPLDLQTLRTNLSLN